MKDLYYGNFKQAQNKTDVDIYIEEIRIKGYTIVYNLFPEEELIQWRERIDNVYSIQEKKYGQENLIAIKDLDVCRAPLIEDSKFIELAAQPFLIQLISSILGDWFILNVQNAVINNPMRKHHQSSWHRDLPYINNIASSPLALNALIAIDKFSEETGGTQLLPISHRDSIIPSDSYIKNNRITANIPAGSALVFDSMLFHRAGSNTSSIIRRAVNHVYTLPVIKQQYDFPAALGHQDDFSEDILKLLGYFSIPPLNGYEWRKIRQERLEKK